MKDPLAPRGRPLAQRWVGNIAFDQLKAIAGVGEICRPPGRQVVEHANPAAGAEQPVDEMAADKAGAAGD